MDEKEVSSFHNSVVGTRSVGFDAAVHLGCCKNSVRTSLFVLLFFIPTVQKRVLETAA